MKILLVIAILAVGILSIPTKPDMSKIDPYLHFYMDTDSSHDILVFIKNKLAMDLTNKGRTWSEQGHYVVNTLRKQAEESQLQVRKDLLDRHVEHRFLWVDNVLIIEQASTDIIGFLSNHQDVRRVDSDRKHPVDFGDYEVDEDPEPSIQAEWNVNWVKAPDMWNLGITGQGMVVGVIDTGIQFDHPALIANYRGNNNGLITHDFHWYDSADRVTTPVDQNSHGTHCTGTVCGTGDTGVGVAPGAKWIHCRAIHGTSQASKYLDCYQFFMAPHDLNRNGGNPDLRPHASSHSYGCGGCTRDALKSAAGNMRSSGIFFSVSAGNNGRCDSISRPPGLYESTFSVAALNQNSDTIASYSSRGPVFDVPREQPDISAPGSSVRSAIPIDRYGSKSGTSMAAPNVAGCVALLWSGVPSLVRNIDATEQIIRDSALGQTSSDCFSSRPTPNNVYGSGTINVLRAYQLAKERGY